MVYKRINKNLDSKVQFVESNNRGIYINSSITGVNFAPYHGIYINESPKCDEVYLSKMVESVLIGKDKYDIIDLKTSENKYSSQEYLESFSDDEVPTFVYNINGVTIEKRYILHPEKKILCVEYKIINCSDKNIKFITKPCVTKRNILETKRESELKFTSLCTPNAAKVALSISENLNLFIKSPNMKYDKKEEYIKGINYDLKNSKKIKTYIEDLYIPGFFEGNIKSGNTNTLSVFVATEDIDVKNSLSHDLIVDIKIRDDIRYGEINNNYYELKELAKTAYKMHYIDNENKKLVLLESIPSVNNSDEYVKNMITSIEGNYLLLKRYKEAHKILESMMTKLKDTTYSLSDFDRCESMLLFIEALNRYLMITEENTNEISEFYKYIKDIIYEYLDKKYKNIYADKDFFLVVNEKRYIKLNALWYNALRIFVDLADKFNEESEFVYSISETLRENIEKKFWDEEKNVLKFELEDTSYASIDMLYTLSLSYPVLKDNNISMRLMDTAFKKLYTAFGMRLKEAGSRDYDGFVYPHLMVHFLKANLRQMGVTRASQKLAYNLVKEIFLSIGKMTSGTVSYKYDEKSLTPCGVTISSITNAEIIRAFELLT